MLVKNQTDQTENGIYTSAVGAWTRTSDADTGTELEGAAVLIQEGSTQADEKYTQTADNITIGVTNIVWVLFDSGTGVTASNGLEKVGSDIRVKGPGQGLEVAGGGDLQATDAVVAAQEWDVTILTLDGTDISNAFKDIAGETVRAGQATRVELTPVGGPEQEYTVDFTVINDGGAVLRRVNWSGLGLDGVLISGDKLIVRFPSA